MKWRIALTFKRALDIVGAASLLIIFSPIILFISLLIRLTMGSPIFFQQTRPGHGGRPFVIIKFRTMVDRKDNQGNLLPDDQRLTKLGRFMRNTTLDELPELTNVMRNELSLVGPRPLLMEYMDRYTPEQARRHDVKPGITGWAQVNGRNAVTHEDKFDLDVWYVNHWSLWLDLKILLLTPWKVLKREGIREEGHATKTAFEGNRRTARGRKR